MARQTNGESAATLARLASVADRYDPDAVLAAAFVRA
jgi:hypothetical protein